MEFVNESEAYVYNCRGIDENSFTKTELLSINLSQLIMKYNISRAAHRDIVRFVNTAFRDYDEIKLGK